MRELLLPRLLDGHAPPALTGAPVGRHHYAKMLLAGGFPEARTPVGGAAHVIPLQALWGNGNA